MGSYPLLACWGGVSSTGPFFAHGLQCVDMPVRGAWQGLVGLWGLGIYDDVKAV